MRILFSAIDQVVPGSDGGSVHTQSVAEGLAALGHEVHVIASPGSRPFPEGPVRYWPVAPPLGIRQLRLLRTRAVLRVAEAVRPDVVIERYYNFGGESLLAARRVGAFGVLEVDSPAVDYAGSLKQRLDRLLVVQPMRRWRDWQCDRADLVITPSVRIVPAHLPPRKVLHIETGADTTMFHPRATGPVPFTRGPSETVAIFAGAFRAWHGAIHLVEAIRRLRARNRRDITAVLAGDGPEFERVKQEAAGLEGVIFTGALPHERIPACLAAADVGVAPFDVAAHPPLLAHDFYWSPLKIYEYMASGLPVVTPRIRKLEGIVRDGQEGILYDPADPDGLARALERLSDPEFRAALGRAARERAVAHLSWDRHCRELVAAIEEARRAAS